MSEAIVEVQRDFFELGPEALLPLTRVQIADRVGVHESTVSRVVSNKYVQTPCGVFPLSYFFSPRLETRDGRGIATRAVMHAIGASIDQEDKLDPISDADLAASFQGRGILVSRRTVAKHREALHLPGAVLRRRYL